VDGSCKLDAVLVGGDGGEHGSGQVSVELAAIRTAHAPHPHVDIAEGQAQCGGDGGLRAAGVLMAAGEHHATRLGRLRIGGVGLHVEVLLPSQRHLARQHLGKQGNERNLGAA
jgi:hypothetical protein